MEPFQAGGPEKEAIIQKRILKRLLLDGWFAKATHGNEFQKGFPDIFACHNSYGSRWIDVKRPKGYKIKDSQHHAWREMAKRNVGVWILCDSIDWEMNKLYQPANWYTYLSAFQTHNRSSKPIAPWSDPRKQPDGPERRIQNKVKKALEADDWYCLDTHGNIYQYGFADLYACHKKYGSRWIEIKNPTGHYFTPAQLKIFPLMQAHGCGVWVLTSESEIDKLFQAANWWQYLDVFKS